MTFPRPFFWMLENGRRVLISIVERTDSHVYAVRWRTMVGRWTDEPGFFSLAMLDGEATHVPQAASIAAMDQLCYGCGRRTFPARLCRPPVRCSSGRCLVCCRAGCTCGTAREVA